MSRRDLAHVIAALARLSGRDPDRVVTADAIGDAVGRTRGDMRTGLDLGALAGLGHAAPRGDGWTITPEGLEWLTEQDELSTQ